ncbi:MAG TPA: glycosyltransferase family 2 protein [Terracidiphilus sp.]|nr:glycosyltransferase family 2 protein [Terracidiphilus sp.]
MPDTNSHLLQERPYPSCLSLVIPLFNEEASAPFLYTALNKFMTEVSCETEVVLVNDGSTDRTLGIISQWASNDPRIKVVTLSRSFGHQAALTAGLDYATGDAIVTMDADLQHPLHVIHRMLERYCEGYDVIYGQRQVSPGETWFKRFTSWLFYRFMRTFIYEGLPADSGDFRMLSRPCLNGLQEMRETHRFLRGMVAWVGFPQIGVPYEQMERVAGSSKYTIRKMVTLAWTAATSFSALPLKISITLGIFVTLGGLGEGIHALMAVFFHWYVVPGWTSLIVLVSVLGGATLVSIGLLGEYVGKLYEQAKNRPLYLVSRTVNVAARASANENSSIREQRFSGIISG